MSIKKLFQKNKEKSTVSKYLKKSSPESLGSELKTAGALSESVKRNNTFVPPINYGNPSEFAKFGSAEKYYENAFEHIADNYPYDGSRAEKNKFYNDLNFLEKFIFSDVYPKSTGFVELGTNYGTAVSGTSHYFSASKEEYIQIKGGPHSGTIFATGSNRTSNLSFGGVSGSTVEFFLSKSAIPGGGTVDTTQSPKQIILDVWNGAPSGTLANPRGDYGRLTIELSKSQEDRFLVTMVSGADTGAIKKAIGFMTQSIPTTGSISSYILGGWNQYSFVFNTDTSTPTIDFYINGECHETGIAIAQGATLNGTIGTVTGSLVANLGALRTAPSGTDGRDSPAVQEGYGKLSGSIDEFRFWKKARNGEEIGRNWFSNVDGVADEDGTDIELGVYYKFNEGITGTSSVDNIVLDYAGRLSNGAWTRYEAVGRKSGSAINQKALTKSLVSVEELGDPIIRKGNEEYITTKKKYIDDGRQHDYQNTAYMMNSLPTWIREQDEDTNNELSSLTQIMSSYFDTLHTQVSYLTKIKDTAYISGSATGSINEFIFNDRLLENYGIEAPELFENASVLERFFNRGEDINFEQDLVSIKNTIYKNIYNNLSDIYKSKGSEKAIRNLIRCFGIDENILSLNVYSNNTDYKLSSSYRAGVSSKKYIDFSGLRWTGSNAATVYQVYTGSVQDSFGVISGTLNPSPHAELGGYGFTTQGEFVFPNRQNVDDFDLTGKKPLAIVTSSLFGFHTPRSPSPSNEDTSWAHPHADSDYKFSLVAIKSSSAYSDIELSDPSRTKDAYFKLEIGKEPNTAVLSTEIFKNVYDNSKWNFAVSVVPKKYPYADGISGSATGTDGFQIVFYGVNYDTGIKRNHFYLTQSLTGSSTVLNISSGTRLVETPKRFFVGAHRTNFTGALLTSSDVRASSIRYWTDFLETGTIDLHARSPESYGRLNPIRQAFTFQSATHAHHPYSLDEVNKVFIPQIETLALNWDFGDITSSTTDGKFTVLDYSAVPISGNGTYESTYQGALAKINSVRHTGRGQFFSSSGKPAYKEYVYGEKLLPPELISSDDFIQVLDSDVELFTPLKRPTNFYFSLEKSMYRGISDKMLNLFASINEMNNLIGEPVHRYRQNYKSMEKLREIFFRRVSNTPDLQKYLDYYKWIDFSMGSILEQLFPVSSKYAPGVRTMIESHILERPKYKYTFLGNRSLDDDYYIRIVQAMAAQNERHGSNNNVGNGGQSNRTVDGAIIPLGWNFAHAPVGATPFSNPENQNSFWWKARAEKTNPTIKNNSTTINEQRQLIFNAIKSEWSSSKAVTLNMVQDTPVINGSNYLQSKQIANDFFFSEFGLNSGEAPLSQSVEQKDSDDVIVPNLKKRVPFRATVDDQDFKGNKIAPFTPVSSSVSEGYHQQLINQGLRGVEFNNLHTRQTSLQSPFTYAHIGGRTGERIAPLTPSGTGPGILGQQRQGRPENFKIRFTKTAVAACNLTVASGLAAGDYALSDINGKTLTLAIGGVSYSALVNSSVAIGDSTKTVIGVNGASDNDDLGTAIVNSINAAIAGDSLPVSVSNAADSAIPIVTSLIAGKQINAIDFGGTYPASIYLASTGFTGGETFYARMESPSTGSTPKGQYRKNVGGDAIINISNIKISSSGVPASTGELPLLQAGINVLGNYQKTYQIVQTNDRSHTNMDFALDNIHYYTSSLTSGSMPSAFITPGAARSTGRTGSTDYLSPRQRSTVRTNNSIFVQRFSAPGSKEDSKQQFRDVPSDQMSPNNALPFRNIGTRKWNHKNLYTHINWGGFTGSSARALSTFSTVANTTAETLTKRPLRTGLDILNSGETKAFGYDVVRINLTNAAFGNGDTLTFSFLGVVYSAVLDATVAPGSSNATTIGINGLSSAGNDAELATAIATSISALGVSQPALYNLFDISAFGTGGTPNADAFLKRRQLGNDLEGQEFGGTLFARSGVTSVPFSGPSYVSGEQFFFAEAGPFHKTQRNGIERIEISASSADISPNFENYTFKTASIYDNAYVSRPIPAGDRYKWFIDLSGNNINTYQQYVLSSSRYPDEITFATSSLFHPHAAASGYIQIGVSNPSTQNGRTYVITDAGDGVNGATVTAITFTADSSQDLNLSTRTTATAYTFGVKSAGTTGDVAESLRQAINDANAAGDFSVTAADDLDTIGGIISVRLTQDVKGTTGNTTIAGTAMGVVAFASGMAGGTAGETLFGNFGNSAFTGSSGRHQYVWAKSLAVAPWSQIRAGQTWTARYLAENNKYRFNPRIKSIDAIKEGSLTGKTKKVISAREVAGTRTSFLLDMARNPVSASFSKEFREPPITSKYKPIVHHIEAVAGTPSTTNKDLKKDITLKYSYGNSLQGFANKEINVLLGRKEKFNSGKTRRPYEIIRDKYTEGVSKDVTGIEMIKLTAYEETIYPREIYTYLSGTRQRLSYTCSFWRDDNVVDPFLLLNVVPQLGPSSLPPQDVNKYNSGSLQEGLSSQWTRIQTQFTTSQGSNPFKIEQQPSGVMNSTEYSLNGSGQVIGPGIKPGTLGSGSMWPLDSFLFSEVIDEIPGDTGQELVGLGEADTRLTLALVSTLPAGELMMPHHGRVISGSAVASTSSPEIKFTSGSLVSAQYVYTVPVERFLRLEPGATDPSYGRVAEGRAPGSAVTRPAWTAALHRKIVEGTNKGVILPKNNRPFYNSYEDFILDAKNKGKDHTIIPEFRISEKLTSELTGTNLDAMISSSLSLTGASLTVFDSTNDNFLPRYSTTDLIEYLDPFMKPGTADLDFNKSPRHFEMKSDAVLKLLPYDGFYPVNRTLEIAALFSQSYGPEASWTGNSTKYENPIPRWRTLLRPFFAPGILYNSIKGGIGVQYPILRENKNIHQFSDTSNFHPLAGPLSGTITTTGNGRIPGDRRRRVFGTASNFDFDHDQVDHFFWSDVIPFEGILNPMQHISDQQDGVCLSDTNEILSAFTNTGDLTITGSVSTTGSLDETLYKMAISNFLASVPTFFLKEKKEGGFMTKFVAEIPSEGSNLDPAGTAPKSQTEARTVYATSDNAYIMEVGLKKTDNFNLYNNPYAFGPPTATGSKDWDNIQDGSSNHKQQRTSDPTSLGGIPQQRDWPLHRGEFAPFTPTYYYGPSLARITFMPANDGYYSMEQILNGGETYVEYLNSDGYYYDFASGSFVTEAGALKDTLGTPDYEWNRAWQNRQDLDASVVIDNLYPTDSGEKIKPMNSDKWVIMPKWECPVLDFSGTTAAGKKGYDTVFSSSVIPFSYSCPTVGQWHQYGVMPDSGEGIYLYISEIDEKSTEWRLLGNPTGSQGAGTSAGTGKLERVKKVPKSVIDSGRTIDSLASLVGFNQSEIMPANEWDPSKAKRIGELAETNEKSLSEAIVAMPFYIDEKTNTLKAISIKAKSGELGPKIKEFRSSFTKYSLPPSLRKGLADILPSNYPRNTETTVINPFGHDSLDDFIGSEDSVTIPVVYLLEHAVSLSRQDLADIWQGIMPDISNALKTSVVAIDHYMPGNDGGTVQNQFPEILSEQIRLNIPRTGVPRSDLLDTSIFDQNESFNPNIRWIVFKVKQRGQTSYHDFIVSEINGGIPMPLSYDDKFGYTSDNLSDKQKEAIEKEKSRYTKDLYTSTKIGENLNTFNWPYDYCSLIELGKLTAKVGFRPDLEKEVEEFNKKRDGKE